MFALSALFQHQYLFLMWENGALLCRRVTYVTCSSFVFVQFSALKTNTRKVLPCRVTLVCHSSCHVLVKWPEGRNPDTTHLQQFVVDSPALLENEGTPRLCQHTSKICAGVLHIYCYLKTLLHICTVTRQKVVLTQKFRGLRC